MSQPGTPSPVMVCCSVFQAEVQSLHAANWPLIPIRYQNSMLHMKPQSLAQHLQQVVSAEAAQGRGVVLIYGDCCMAMAALEALPNVIRTRGKNCCELLLGNDAYRRLSHQGAFFLFPEWTSRWREIFTTHLGLTQENATSLMGDMHRKLIYVDTGVLPVPHERLQEAARYCGLPYEVQAVSLEPLRDAIQEALARLEAKRSTL